MLNFGINFLQSAGAKKCRRIGVSPTEASVEVHRLVAASLLEDIASERHRSLWIEDSVLHEELEGVLVEDFCPEIAVVTGTVSAAEDVCELCGAVAWDDLVDKTHFLADGLLEGLDERFLDFARNDRGRIRNDRRSARKHMPL